MLPRQLVKTFITVFMFFFLATTSAGALDFFEDFNGAGAPPNHADYWYKMNEIYPTQSIWDDYIPGDGHVYITVDNSSSWGDYQGIGIGWIPNGHRMEVRMKGALVTGYVGFIFSYASSADEIDIELVPDDTQGEGGVHDPYEWSDARFNTTIHGDPWNANFKGIVDDSGSKVSHYEDDTYHTYTIDWFTDRVVFYIDGVHQQTNTSIIPQDDSEIILGFRDLDWAGTPNWSGTKTMTIDWLNVQPIDLNTPVADADRYATDPNTPITIAGSGILANDTGSNLTADLVSDVAHGTLSLNANGSFTYTPDSGFIGEDHFVYFANDGTSYGESNAARVLLRVGQPVEWQKVDDSDASIAYSAGWGTYVGTGGYMNTEHFSETTGATATFDFTGTQARYYGFKRNDLGKVNIYVDATYITTLDLYSSTFLGDHLLFETAVLPLGPHTLKVELDGTMNSSSSGFEANIDAFSWIDMGANPPAQNEIMAWVPSYGDAESRLMAAADFGTCSPKDGLTRVGLQFWEVASNGTIGYEQRSYINPPLQDSDVNWWTDWGQANDIDILLTVHNHDGDNWNWDMAFSAFGTNRTTLVNSLVAEVERLGLDGVDMDFEGCGDLDYSRDEFAQFIQELSAELKARGKVLTVDSFRYIWCAPNLNWRPDWLGYVDNIHVMGYEDLYEGSTVNSGGNYYNRYSFHQNAAVDAGYAANDALMGFPGDYSSWGTSTGYGTSAWAHLQEVRYDLSHGPTGIAIWDLYILDGDWQTSELWCEIVALKTETTPSTPPTAGFNYSTSGLTASFTDTSTDSGNIVSWSWNFDDGSSSTEQNPSYTFAADGIYSVSLSVTDNDGDSDSVTRDVSVSASSGGAPTPNPMTWATLPYLNSNWPDSDVVTMKASTASDLDGGIEYYLDCVEAPTGDWWHGCEDISWQTSPTFSDWYVQPGYTFHYRVKARDGLGNETDWSPEASFSHGTPSDTEAPVITAPDDVTVEATGETTSVILGSPTVSDNLDPDPEVSTNAPAVFEVGITTVIWTATDASGNSASDTQTVTVTDTTAPTITAPADVSVESSEPTAVALGTPTVSDLADPNPTVTNNAPALFPLGTTTVTWTATDASGNSETDTQTVTVTAPPLPSVIHVGDLDAIASGNKRWTATVTITVHDSSNVAVAGVTVSGTWSDGSIGSCVTDDIGQCSTARITKELSLTFTVDSLSSGEDTYDAGANHDPDGDSDGTSITINKDGGTGDTTPPTITLKGDNPVSIEVGSTYVDAGATASDDIDGDLTSAIETVSTVNTAEAGTYTVTYNVSDNAGNIADQVVRTVTVTDPGAPAAPAAPTLSVSVSGYDVTLNWTDTCLSEDCNYSLVRASKAEGRSNFYEISHDGQSVTITESGGTYYYKVKAISGGIASDYSNVITIRLR